MADFRVQSMTALHAHPYIRPVNGLWSRFELLDTIGEGSYGVVWRCRERSTGKLFACKVQHKEPKALKTMWREIDAMLQVGKHANIVDVEGIYDSKDWLYIVMELCTAGDLLTRVNETHGLPEEVAAQLFEEIVMAVHCCHKRGVLHRDIKPENILLSHVKKGDRSLRQVRRAEPITAKLADFGLAVPIPRHQMVVGYAGSFPYEAPEVIADRPYNFSADVWSLGMLLYAMLSASLPPFPRSHNDSSSSSSSTRRFDPALHFKHPGWQTITPAAKNLITRMLAHNPLNRPSTAEILSHPWFLSFSLLNLRRASSLDKLTSAETRTSEAARQVSRPATVASAVTTTGRDSCAESQGHVATTANGDAVREEQGKAGPYPGDRQAVGARELEASLWGTPAAAAAATPPASAAAAAAVEAQLAPRDHRCMADILSGLAGGGTTSLSAATAAAAAVATAAAGPGLGTERLLVTGVAAGA